MSDMTKTERDNLIRLSRRHAKAAAGQVEERAAVMRADVKDQLTAEERFDDELWSTITTEAAAVVGQAQQQITEICRQSGKPAETVPELRISWIHRGRAADADRRRELEQLANRRIEAMVKSAKAAIDREQLRTETELLAGTFESAEARQWLDRMPAAEDLLPPIDLAELGGRQDLPAGSAGQLVTPTTTGAREAKRRALGRALAANPEASDREIGRIAGVDHKTVARARQLAQAGELNGELPGALPGVGSDHD